jgi:hypothetical protein
MRMNLDAKIMSGNFPMCMQFWRVTEYKFLYVYNIVI